MESILNILTDEEKNFIKKHNLSPSDFYDARGETQKVYHEKAKKAGCLFVIKASGIYYVRANGFITITAMKLLLWDIRLRNLLIIFRIDNQFPGFLIIG